MKEWQSFSQGHPQLGMAIDINTGPTEELNMGVVESIKSLGGEWLGINTDAYKAIAVRKSYQWRESA